jgi:hypothetical protein
MRKRPLGGDTTSGPNRDEPPQSVEAFAPSWLCSVPGSDDLAGGNWNVIPKVRHVSVLAQNTAVQFATNAELVKVSMPTTSSTLLRP